MSAATTARAGIPAAVSGREAEAQRVRAVFETVCAQAVELVSRGDFRGSFTIHVGPRSVTTEMSVCSGEEQGYDFGVT